MTFEDRLRELHPELAMERQVSLADYTTLRVGGPAEYFVEPPDAATLCDTLRAARETGMPLLLLGNGSNLLVRDGGFAGVAVRLGGRYAAIEQTPDGLTAQSGALMSILARRALECGLTGLEFAQGIPGTVGGGVYMNAGAYGGEMGQVVRGALIWDGEAARYVDKAEMRFAYRHTAAMENDWVILAADFALPKGERGAIEAAMRDFAARRREKQPLEYPSAGSFFKRPAGHYAGGLIEQAGLKGAAIGGAQVSVKHAGFLINVGNATARDFLLLMEHVQDVVQRRFGVRLEPEVRIVGRDA